MIMEKGANNIIKCMKSMIVNWIFNSYLGLNNIFTVAAFYAKMFILMVVGI